MRNGPMKIRNAATWGLVLLVISCLFAVPATTGFLGSAEAAAFDEASRSGDEPLIAPLPDRVVSRRLYLTGLSRSNQVLRVYLDGVPQVQTSGNESGDFAAAIDLRPGQNEIHVVAVDFGRETDHSQSVIVDYAPVRADDTTAAIDASGISAPAALLPPVLNSLSSPTLSNPITVTGTATAGVTVRFFVNNVAAQSGVVPVGGHFSIHVPLEDGANSIYAVADDGAGHVSGASNTVATSYSNIISRTLGGSLTQDTALTAGNGTPYAVTTNLTIPAGFTLWLEPGATFKFAANTKILVQGALVIRGTSGHNVLLTSDQATPTVGYWAGIEVASAATLAQIDFGQVEYAVSGVYFNGSGATVGAVSHSLIRNNSKGIYVMAPSASPVIALGNEITANKYGVYVQGNSTAALNPLPVVNGNSIHDNVNSGSTIYDYYATTFGNPTSTALDATANWWGTTDAGIIGSHIYDWNENATSPIVNYASYFGAPGGPVYQIGPTLDGPINSDTTLTPQTYLVLGTVEVSPGVTLTIQPGVSLVFPGNYTLRVKGNIKAVGSSTQRIVFTSSKSIPAVGDWAGIEITSTATKVTFDYVEVSYSTNGIYFNGSAANVGTVSHSLVHNNSKGIYVKAPSAAPVIGPANEISANQYGLYVQGNSTAAQNPAPVVTANSIHDNVYSGSTIYDYYAVTFGNPGATVLNATANWWGTTETRTIGTHIYDWTDQATSPVVNYASYFGAAGGPVYQIGPTLDGQINADTTLPAATYLVLGNVEVAPGVTLTISPGATLLVAGDYVLRVKGTLNATGTSAQHVIFTSSASVPAIADWSGIEITSTATLLTIDYAEVSYADDGIYFNGTPAGIGTVSRTSIHNNTIGIHVAAPSASPSVGPDNEITANKFGLKVVGNSTAAQNPMPVVHGNSIHDNVYSGTTVYDYYAQSFGNPTGTVLDATGNWWGTTNPATIASHIYDLNESSSSPLVNYANYLSAPDGTPVYTGPTLIGTISTNTALAAQAYQVLGTVEVSAGVTLTIPAGASLIFTSNYALRIRGSLVVTGSAAQPVVFTSGKTPPAISDWAGIEITSTATNVSIDYGRIEYATNGLYFNGCAAGVGLISHTLIQNNSKGVFVLAPNCSPTISPGNEITANTNGVWVQGNNIAGQNPMPVATGNSIHDNTAKAYEAISFVTAATTVLNATGNWWGTTDYWSIDTQVFDHYDSSGSPYVGYDGFLASATDPLPGAVVYGVLLTANQVQPLETVVAQGTYRLATRANVTTEIIRESDNAIVFSGTTAVEPGIQSFSWDGRGTAGDIQPVGLYRVAFVAERGNSTTTDAAAPPRHTGAVSGSVPTSFDPFRNIFLKVNVSIGSQGRRLTVDVTPSGAPLFLLLDGVYYPGGQSWVYWDGRDPSGQVVTTPSYVFFELTDAIRRTALILTGTQTEITGTGAVPDIEVKSNPYLVTHSFEEISTITYRIDLDSYVTVKMLPPGIYDPSNPAAITLIDNELEQANDSGGQPIDHAVEWRGYDVAQTNHIETADEGAFTFTIEARSQQTNLTTLYRGVLQLRR